MIQPLYVMNRSLPISVSFACLAVENRYLQIASKNDGGEENSHDEEGIKHLHAIQRRLDRLALLLFRRDGIACHSSKE